MNKINGLFYKDGEEWKPLAYGDIITITEPDEEKAPEPEALELLMEEPMTFTCQLKNPKIVKRLLRRLAKRNGREWRLYKVKAKWRAKATVRAEVRKWVQGLTRQDCVGFVPGYCRLCSEGTDGKSDI